MKPQLRNATIAGFMAWVILATGCLPLRDETTLTLYLDPDGEVTWNVLQRNIRSDDRDPARRAEREREFLEQFARQEHPALVALGSLSPSRLDSRMLRQERPYAILTTARYTSVDRLLENLFAEVGVGARAALGRDGDVARLEIVLFDLEGNEEAAAPGGNALVDILMRGEELRVVLTAGEFVEATGFKIGKEEDVAVLVFDDLDEPEDESEEIVISLVWMVD